MGEGKGKGEEEGEEIVLGANAILGRPLGYFIFSLIGFNRVIFRNIFQRGLWAILEYSLGSTVTLSAVPT